MKHYDKCKNCIFCKETRDMGASWDVCSIWPDIAKASKYPELPSPCDYRVTEKGLATFVKQHLRGDYGE